MSEINPELREETAIQHVKKELAADLSDEHSPDEVEHAVDEAAEHYSEVPVRDFVPSLVEREARERLTEEPE
jgi:hypothetical protein